MLCGFWGGSVDENKSLHDFAVDLQQEVIARADADEDGALRQDAFTELAIGYLADAGEIDDGMVGSFAPRGMRCDAYFLSEDNDRLDLFVSIPCLSGSVTSVSKTEIEAAIRRLQNFFARSTEGLHESLEESSPGFAAARDIFLAKDDLSHVRLFVLTDGVANVDRLEPETWRDVQVTRHVWDLRRLHRAVSSGLAHEPISIDFSAIGSGPPVCLVAAPEGSGYRCLVTMLPGDTLVELYRRFGPRLLERNVRSFLQLKGKVNQGIRKTILEEPQMFLAFNNGLSVTATGLQLELLHNGTARLISATDFQIVNGGQTTGSIFRASRKDHVDASRITVPVKITEILAEGDVESIAPRISESANNQNKVNVADFSSNSPFHRKLEELSRSIWAPPSHGMQRQTKWFYERARGQYHDALAREATPAQRRAFEATHPRRQLLTKTDLAKIEQTWSQTPHLVSRGAQKCYLQFMEVIKERGSFLPDETYFQRMVARAILFRETERIVSKQKFGGYRANIVTYSVAWLSHSTGQRLNLDRIWAAQEIPQAVANALEAICIAAHGHITSPPGGQNITEWCKKEQCWLAFQQKRIELPAALDACLATRESAEDPKTRHTTEEQPTAEEAALIARVAGVTAETWFALSAWAKDAQALASWQRSLAYSLGKLASYRRSPSRKQAVQGDRILSEAKRLGFAGPDDGLAIMEGGAGEH